MVWNEYDPQFIIDNPDLELVTYMELVLDDDNNMKEVKQIPGINNVLHVDLLWFY